MSELKKSICKLDRKELQKWLPVIAAGAREGRFICRKCGRIAVGKKMLCKPTSIQSVLDT